MQCKTRTHILQAARQFGTPFFFYDLGQIRNTYDLVRKNLNANCRVHYSMKANPSLGICEWFNHLGAGCEVASQHELEIALIAGFKSTDIIFVGPGKTKEELEFAMRKNILSIICESLDEISNINAMAKKQHKKISIMVRLNPSFFVREAPIKMGGVATQFGMDLETFEKNIPAILSMENIILQGIHIYNGSRILNAEALYKNTQNILSLAKTLSEKYHHQFSYIDIGGGWGVPYFSGEQALEIKSLCHQINKVTDDFMQHDRDTKIILELGRFLIAEAGRYVFKKIGRAHV